MNRGCARHPVLQRGLTLIELMVAMLLGLFLVGVVSLAYLQTASGARFSTMDAQMNEEGALALDLLRSQLALAGFSSVNATTGKRVFTGLAVWGCDQGFADTGAAFGAGACKTSGSLDGAIALSYEATPSNSITTGSQTTPSNCANEAIDLMGSLRVADNRFFIMGDVDGNPTLYCKGGTGTGFSDRVALVPNIERLRLRFAITRATTRGEVPPHQVTNLVDASTLTTVDDWARVAAVDICVLVRSERPVPRSGLTMDEVTRHVDCDGAEQAATDGRLRRSYRTLVALPNVRPLVPRPYNNDAGTVANPYTAPGQ